MSLLNDFLVPTPQCLEAETLRRRTKNEIGCSGRDGSENHHPGGLPVIST